MSTHLPELGLRCKCGNVRGVLRDAAESTGNRVVCYCKSCQAFAKFLERTDILDKNGGTDIFQMAPGRVEMTEGKDQLRALRLSEKGLIRWFTACCHTPVGNTVGPKLPFVGLILAFVDPDTSRAMLDSVLGKPRVYVNGKDATGSDHSHIKAGVSRLNLLRASRLMLAWWVTGKGTPSPFFDSKTGAPIATPKVLSDQERAAVGG